MDEYFDANSTIFLEIPAMWGSSHRLYVVISIQHNTSVWCKVCLRAKTKELIQTRL